MTFTPGAEKNSPKMETQTGTKVFNTLRTTVRNTVPMMEYTAFLRAQLSSQLFLVPKCGGQSMDLSVSHGVLQFWQTEEDLGSYQLGIRIWSISVPFTSKEKRTMLLKTVAGLRIGGDQISAAATLRRVDMQLIFGLWNVNLILNIICIVSLIKYITTIYGGNFNSFGEAFETFSRMRDTTNLEGV